VRDGAVSCLCGSTAIILTLGQCKSSALLLLSLLDNSPFHAALQAEKTLMIEQRREDFHPERSTSATPGASAALHGASSVPAMQGSGDRASGTLASRHASSANLDAVVGKGGSGGRGADGIVRSGSGTCMQSLHQASHQQSACDMVDSQLFWCSHRCVVCVPDCLNSRSQQAAAAP
jgi:hypothetical protein